MSRHVLNYDEANAGFDPNKALIENALDYHERLRTSLPGGTQDFIPDYIVPALRAASNLSLAVKIAQERCFNAEDALDAMDEAVVDLDSYLA